FIFVHVCGATIAILGLAMATWFSRIGQAVMLTIFAYVLVTVGLLFAGLWVRPGADGEGFMMGSPFFFAGELAAEVSSPGVREHIGWGVFWIVFYGLTALALLLATLATFNRCLGRVEGGLPLVRRTSRTRGKAS